MNIVVCLKQVPDTETKVQIQDGKSLKPDGVTFIPNPYDEFAIEEALKLNSEIPHGAVAIREIDGESKFVMIDTYPRGTVDVEEIRRSVLEVAHRADAIEKLLTGLDRH